MSQWSELTRRASFASHQLIGWIFWDPRAKENLAQLGVPDGLGHYITYRSAPLAAAGADVVTASFFTIKREFIQFSLAHARPHISDWHAVSAARDAAVFDGLKELAPEIISPLGALADALWEAADAIPFEGRVLFEAHRAWPRPTEPVLLAWNALNTIREWRGDTHFAILVSENINAVEAGLLHDAWMGYPKEWIPRSRGADDAGIAAALATLDERGFVTNGVINDAGVAYRQELEDRTDVLCEIPWRTLGQDATEQMLAIIEPVGSRFVSHIDNTAGDNWMPAARPRRR